ncbi:PREDICTED: uncharacterized protein LOC107069621 isoform X1 [Polistes dominula]|uniref:Uncharacterized protein LOC107069621 isoform X1 n=1 Tax=Polistes dominula TaxID=743375 RepID=A0ABM1IQT4_POLDO|nr:PREDICTED: uncharacterized protein LOC107069621 isoform X1 [Polistes dominula]XP_015182571.1 PREDICTED: uncharacterized protein LOC107069621 isoform X1 [Polistes dominula]
MDYRNDQLMLKRTRKINKIDDDDDDDDDEEEDLQITAIHRRNLTRIFLKHLITWAQDSVDRLPIRVTLCNLGILVVLLAIVLPKTLTYILLYPIFRLGFGTLYPAYASYKAVRTQNVKEYVKWMMYWIVFALFTCAETFTDVFFSFWFPFYYEIKIILVLWLLSPTTKGSSILYRRFVHPALTRHEAEIDEAFARATEQGYKAVLHLGTRGVNYATTVLMQTAIKGGGGLVQQLRKSYSLSDLTGGKHVDNRSLPEPQDETDMEDEPRRREHVGRRGYSPRRTQSSTNRVEMYFSEVDVDMIQPRPREPIASLTNIRSSDDISSGYSSGEALQSHRIASQGDALVRTSSVGARTRVKPRSTAKKTPEDAEEESKNDDLLLPSPLTLLTPDQLHQLLLLLDKNDDHRMISKSDSNEQLLDNLNERDESKSSSSEESEVWFIPNLSSETDNKQPQTELLEIDNNNLTDCQRSSEILTKPSSNEQSDLQQKDMENKENNEMTPQLITNSFQTTDANVDINKIKDEICREKLDELKELLNSAHKTVTKLVSSEENLNQIDKLISDKAESLGNLENIDSSNIWSTTNVTRSKSDCNDRAGKYNKKLAPKAPVLTQDDVLSDSTESENALKATLVIKTGMVKTFSTVNNAKDVFIAHASQTKNKKKKRSKDGITKLLSIPKNIFHGAFHKNSSGSNKDEDTSPSVSEYSSRSRSVSVGSQDITTTNEITSNVDNNKSEDSTSDNCNQDTSSDKMENSDAKVTSVKRILIPQMSHSPGASRKVYFNEDTI